MPIYAKSTNELLMEYIEGNLNKDQTLERGEIIAWFNENYPRIDPSTVSCHVTKFTTNHRSRIYYGARPQHDKLFQLPNKLLRLYDPRTDPKPLYTSDDIITSQPDEERAEETSEFAYESHLRDYLMHNLHKIEAGLRLYKDEEDEAITGVEFDAGGKYIDILAVDEDDNLVVIEIKVSKGYERAVGQLLRYKAWVKKNIADGRRVRGIVIAKNISEDLKLAAGEATDVELFEYDLKVDLRKIQPSEWHLNKQFRPST